ncbi:fruR/shl operon leader peptide [Escherichia coli]|nr:fruR/shl operon leader peptide [Escherichia coli]
MRNLQPNMSRWAFFLRNQWEPGIKSSCRS